MIIAPDGSTTIELCPHNPQWRGQAQEEAFRLCAALGDNLLCVEHIGSTAISGILAKPIIDLMPIVRSLAELDKHAPVLQKMNYEWRGEFGIEGRRYCVRDEPLSRHRLFQLHFFESGSEHIQRHVAFRDYLLANRDQVLAYENEKKQAALRAPFNTNRYNDCKSAWIVSCEARALEWFDRRQQEEKRT